MRRKGVWVPSTMPSGEGHIPPRLRSAKGKFEYLLMMKQKPGVDFARVIRDLHLHEEGVDNGFYYCAPRRGGDRPTPLHVLSSIGTEPDTH